MKRVIRIPCHNQEDGLPSSLQDVPEVLPGIDLVEFLIVDGGHTDHSRELAQELGVHQVIQIKMDHLGRLEAP